LPEAEPEIEATLGGQCGLFIGRNDFVAVSVGALVSVNGAFGGRLRRNQFHFVAADSANDRDRPAVEGDNSDMSMARSLEV
jgi:hypothetical protein